jgi:ketosteroid isomerase-like protein
MSNFQETAKALNAQWDAAFNAKDAAAVAAMYDDAAAVIPAGAEQVSGKAAILAFWTNTIGQGIIDHKLALIEALSLAIWLFSAACGVRQ